LPESARRRLRQARSHEMERKLRDLLAEALIGRLTAKELRALVLAEADERDIEEAELRGLIIDATIQIIDPEIADHILTWEEMHRISEILSEFQLQFDNLPELAQRRLCKARVLNDLSQGQLPSERPWPSGLMPERGEELIWDFL